MKNTNLSFKAMLGSLSILLSLPQHRFWACLRLEFFLSPHPGACPHQSFSETPSSVLPPGMLTPPELCSDSPSSRAGGRAQLPCLCGPPLTEAAS